MGEESNGAWTVIPTSRIDIDLTAISHNVSVIRRVLAKQNDPHGAKIDLCAVVKADAYGLGSARIAKRLALCGVELFAVHTAQQARALVEGAVMKPILLLMPVRDLERNDMLYRSAMRGQIHFTVHDQDSLAAMISTADRQGIVLPLHLAVDTGMSRGGASPDEALEMLEIIKMHPRLQLMGVYNHLSSADSDCAQTTKQTERFTTWLHSAAPLLPADCAVHEANTFGMLRSATSHRTMVRVGLALLGFGLEQLDHPEHFEFATEAAELRPCFRWMSRIVHTKWIARGTPVGYGATWRARKKTRLGLVPVGYADGYPLALSGKSSVGIAIGNGQIAYAPLVGRVSMDQFVVDITELPEEHVGIGAEVEVVGQVPGAPNHLPVLASQAGTIAHEILCRLNPRLPRTYKSIETPVEDRLVEPIVRRRDSTVAMAGAEQERRAG